MPLKVHTAEDVPADPISARDPATGATSSNNLFTLFDLDEGTILLSSSVTDKEERRADSTSTVWDIGFKGTTVIFNGGTSGPGQGTAQLLTQTFAEVREAPASGYVADGSNTSCPSVETPAGTVSGSTLALCTGSDNGWYNYSGQTQLISPIAGRTLVLTTGEGLYAKLRFLSYYKGNPQPPNAEASPRYYTFQYVVQPNESGDFTFTTPN